MQSIHKGMCGQHVSVLCGQSALTTLMTKCASCAPCTDLNQVWLDQVYFGLKRLCLATWTHHLNDLPLVSEDHLGLLSGLKIVPVHWHCAAPTAWGHREGEHWLKFHIHHPLYQPLQVNIHTFQFTQFPCWSSNTSPYCIILLFFLFSCSMSNE